MYQSTIDYDALEPWHGESCKQTAMHIVEGKQLQLKTRADSASLKRAKEDREGEEKTNYCGREVGEFGQSPLPLICEREEGERVRGGTVERRVRVRS